MFVFALSPNSAHCGQFDIIQDASNQVKPEVKQQVQQTTSGMFAQTPNFIFQVILVPANINEPMDIIRQETFSKYKVDKSSVFVGLLYKQSTNEYQYLIDKDIETRINPTVLQYITDQELVPKMKRGDVNDAMLSAVPRIANFFVLSQLIYTQRPTQQDIKSSSLTLNTNAFYYDKVQNIKPPVKEAPKEDNSSRNRLIIVGSIVAVVLLAGGGYWYYRRKKNSGEEYDSYEDDYRY